MFQQVCITKTSDNQTYKGGILLWLRVLTMVHKPSWFWPCAQANHGQVRTTAREGKFCYHPYRHKIQRPQSKNSFRVHLLQVLSPSERVLLIAKVLILVSLGDFLIQTTAISLCFRKDTHTFCQPGIQRSRVLGFQCVKSHHLPFLFSCGKILKKNEPAFIESVSINLVHFGHSTAMSYCLNGEVDDNEFQNDNPPPKKTHRYLQ